MPMDNIKYSSFSIKGVTHLKKTVLLLITFLLISIQSAGAVSRAEPETQPLYETVKELLPPEAEFIKPNTPESVSSIQVYDFDQDNQQEMMVTYRLENGLG